MTDTVRPAVPAGLAALVSRTSLTGGPAAARVVLAARVTTGVLVAGALGVGIHAVRTGARLLRH